MESFDPLISDAFSLAFLIFAVIVAILWIILPFALFGLKGRLDGVITELQKMNENIKDLRRPDPEMSDKITLKPDL